MSKNILPTTACDSSDAAEPTPDHLRALIAVLIAAHAYALAGSVPHWSALAWLVPGVLLTALTKCRSGWAIFYGMLFALLCGVRFAENGVLSVGGSGGLGALAATVVALLLGAVPYGLFACAYARRAGRTLPAARSSLAAWLWVSCELLHVWVAPGSPWIYLGESQQGSALLASSAGAAGGSVLSFVMVLLSTTVAEALRHRAFVGWRPRVVARWAALPVAALVTLVVLCAALPAKAGVRAEAAPCQSGRTRPIPPACSVGEAVPFARTTSRSLTAI